MDFSVTLDRKSRKYIEQIKGTNLKRAHIKHINEALMQYGEEVRQELAKVIYTGSRSGRVYYYKGQSHTASAPGEPPANRSGRLMNSFQYKRTPSRLTVYSDIDPDKPYPYFLEEGTSKMDARPYFVITNVRKSPELHAKLQIISEEM